MKTSFSFGWKVLVAVLLLFVIGRNEAKAENLMDILKDKMPISQGRCYFKGEKFLAFASGTWMSSGGFIDRVDGCFVFVKDREPMNPVWLVLLNRKGFPKEVIKWDDSFAGSPGEFSSVWRQAEESTNPPEPLKRHEPKQTKTEI